MIPVGLLLAFILPVHGNLLTLKLSGPPSLPPDASHDLHPSLASFSIETAFFETFFGNLTHPNQLSLKLLANLQSRTGVPPEIRIGGITADSTYWDPNQARSSVNFIDSSGALHNTTIGPEFWKSMSLLPQGTQITVNLNLEDLDYQKAFEVARSAAYGIPQGQLAALEIGNEPDHYWAHPFTPKSYSSIWSAWAKNMTTEIGFNRPIFQLAAVAEDPLWPYDAPGASSQLGCVSALAEGANKDNVVSLCSEHTYQYSVCDPPRIVVATLPNLVNHTRLARYIDLWQPRIKSVRSQLGPHSFLIGEYSSVSCSGKDNVSNTFGQALWMLDTTFYAASVNVSRLYTHQGGPLALQSPNQLNHGGLSFYDMWYPVDNKNGVTQVFPSYGAYLFITETLGHSKSLKTSNIYPGRQTNGSTITPALGDASEGQLSVYGFWDTSLPNGAAFPTKLALLNMEIYNETQWAAGVQRPATIFDISAYQQDKTKKVRLQRLQSTGADVKNGSFVTWAGQNYASGSATGTLTDNEWVDATAVTVAASEAVLVFL